MSKIKNNDQLLNIMKFDETSLQNNQVIEEQVTEQVKEQVTEQVEQQPKKIFMHKLFPKIRNVNFKNLMIDETTMTYITTPYETKKIFNDIAPHINKYKKFNKCTIVDATGGAGGDTITFCQFFQSVVSIENDSARYLYLKNNIEQYGFQNCSVLKGDSTLICPKIPYCDAIFVDPPWGGSTYKSKENLELYLGDMRIETFVLRCFDPEIMMSPPKVVALKLPKNYNLKFLFDMLQEKLDIYIYEHNKLNILVIEKKTNNINF